MKCAGLAGLGSAPLILSSVHVRAALQCQLSTLVPSSSRLRSHPWKLISNVNLRVKYFVQTPHHFSSHVKSDSLMVRRGNPHSGDWLTHWYIDAHRPSSRL